jgi:protein-tyrosine kinase
MPLKALDRILPFDPAKRDGPHGDRSLGAILVDAGKLSLADAERVLGLQREKGLHFGDAALQLGLISEQDLRHALSRQHDFTYLLPDEDGVSRELVAAYDPFSDRVEELRTLRTQLLLRWFNAEAGQQSLAVVSPGRGEGRSYLAANLAIVFSQVGLRTLLVDADLRNPRQHALFKVNGEAGLSAYLSGRADSALIVPVPAFPHLAVLVAGGAPPNPQELISRSAFKSLLQELKASFDIVLIDTPAAGLSADAHAITMLAGGALMLTRRHSTRIADARTLVQTLSGTGLTIVGAVVNDF